MLPTDTVYGIGADAFDRNAVTDLLLAKGRGRDMPPPVLVGSVRAGIALIDDLGTYGRDLISEFWPGGLTLVCRATPTLNWDLGDTKGTVAVRMPLHPVALELLKETGPLAVSSANRSGQPPATTAADAEEQLGESVSVYLDGGPVREPLASTIVDLTGTSRGCAGPTASPWTASARSRRVTAEDGLRSPSGGQTGRPPRTGRWTAGNRAEPPAGPASRPVL